MGSPRIPLGFPNATGTPLTDGTAEGSRPLVHTAMLLSAIVGSDVGMDDFERGLIEYAPQRLKATNRQNNRRFS